MYFVPIALVMLSLDFLNNFHCLFLMPHEEINLVYTSIFFIHDMYNVHDVQSFIPEYVLSMYRYVLSRATKLPILTFIK